jgi:uncharacterized membrane protein
MATHYARTVPHWGRTSVNVGPRERKLSVGLGVGLALASMFAPRGRARRTLATTGASLAIRGAAGWCPVYAATGVDRSRPRPRRRAGDPRSALAGSRGLNVRDRITIRRDAGTVYRFWRRLENLPRLIDHLESVVQQDETYSHWVARGPFGLRVEWNAEIINEIPNRLLAWQSREGADLVSAGSVHFRETPLGTEVTVSMQYAPPAGKPGAALAWFFGETPAQQLREGLERLQQELESNSPLASGGSADRPREVLSGSD